MDVGPAYYATCPEVYDSLLLVSAGHGVAGVCPHSQPQHITFSFTMGIFWARRNKVYGFRVKSVQFSHSVMSNSATPWTATHQASLSITKSRNLLKLMSIKSVTSSNYLILCRPLLLPPSIFPSLRVFSKESVLRIRGPKYWSFSFNISPSKEYLGLISFRTDWFGFCAVQGNLKNLLQHHSSKPSLLQHSAFFIVQLSHPYMTTEKS